MKRIRIIEDDDAIRTELTTLLLTNGYRPVKEDPCDLILMVTHDAVVGSYASRVLFLKDGRIWNELHRGDRTRQAMYHEILNTMAVLGGEADVR